MVDMVDAKRMDPYKETFFKLIIILSLLYQFFTDGFNSANTINGTGILDFHISLDFLGGLLSIEGKSKNSNQHFQFGG